MKLIKKLNEQANAITGEKKFKYLDVNAIQGVNDRITEGVDSDVKKLIKQYKEKDFSDHSDNYIKNMIGDDLEMLEYDPEEVDDLITKVFKGLKR